MPQKIALLGSTGSIGTQSLDVISRFQHDFKVGILTGGNNVGLLSEQARKFLPDAVVIGNRKLFKQLKDSLQGTKVKVYAGMDDMEQVVAGSDADIVLAAIVGYSGLRPTMAAVRAGKKIALANKETLVVAGRIITELASGSGSFIIPVDSEHSAIFQCLAGEEKKSVEKITLTASGGPFLKITAEELNKVKPRDALKHPNWNMGDKVTVDSASLMNKGLEMIEAKWLFGLDPEQIKVIIHPQSIIHSFVHFSDGSVKAQLGIPDMRLPILYALSYPKRFTSDLPRLEFSYYKTFTFEEPDLGRFRNLSLATYALRKGGNMPCILNAANEIAVNAFLDEKIGFTQMPEVIEYALENTEFIGDPGIESLEATDIKARELAGTIINKIRNRKCQ
ncbi:MAG: 1-deoxy-D-xylulose-5-phosphate reductoisomerase [Bacteroidales bacterium]|jgi:1-deoxy-D-xylulose-5-phosphate reductoisomerase